MTTTTDRPVTPRHLRRARTAAVLAGIAAVLASACGSAGAKSDRPDRADESFVQFTQQWPTVSAHSAGLDAFVAEAEQEVCEDPQRCHVLWANEARSGSAHQTDRVVLVAEPGDTDATVQITSATQTERGDQEEADLRVGDPRVVDIDVPTVRFGAVDLDAFDGYLLPAGTENVRELRYDVSQRAVVEEDVNLWSDQPDRRAGSGRVWWTDDDWWAARADWPASTEPILRYERAGETVYRMGGDLRVCVGEHGRSCRMFFPSVGALVSLRTTWEQHGFDLNSRDELMLNDAIELDGTFGGLFPEGTTTSTGGVAFLHDVDHSPMRRPDRIGYAVYFDDGYPAVLSAYQDPTERRAPGPDADPFTAAAVFGNPMPRPGMTNLVALVPVAFHPSGTPPLAAPGLEAFTRDHDATIFRPVGRSSWRPVAFTHLDEGGNPVATQWLVDPELRR